MAFTCPRCGRTSHNSNDEREGYCGACRWWTGDPVLGRVSPETEEPTDTGPVAVVPHLTGEELEALTTELTVAGTRWTEVLNYAASVEARHRIHRRIRVLQSLRTAFAEARDSLPRGDSND